jgi:NADH dehydrogenase [ubiquinone] 1 alpha subcomplex assembly factor 7
MTLAEYMAMALGDPDHGYYMRAEPFGAGGDFITAPEISQVFGELLGLWCADTWTRMGAPEPVILCELGPGRGTLMADALRAAASVPRFFDALRVHLVETSPHLRVQQKKALQRTPRPLAANPCWHDSLAGVPEGSLLLIANEFFDALPIRQFVRHAAGRNGGWDERAVALDPDGEGFVFALHPASVAAAALLPPEADETPPGGTFEVCPAAASLAEEIGARVANHGGAALIVDYGFVHPPNRPTLQAVSGHARHEVLDKPGSADLTAHVDFTALIRGAGAARARTWGPVSQGDFLRALGIAARAAALTLGASAAQKADIEAAVARLTGAEAMGELFKVLALGHENLPAPAGFGT